MYKSSLYISYVQYFVYLYFLKYQRKLKFCEKKNLEDSNRKYSSLLSTMSVHLTTCTLTHNLLSNNLFLFFQYSEFLDSVLTKGADIFKSFDFKLEGDFSLPRQTINFFHLNKFFLIGGIVPMTFGKNLPFVSVLKYLHLTNRVWSIYLIVKGYNSLTTVLFCWIILNVQKFSCPFIWYCSAFHSVSLWSFKGLVLMHTMVWGLQLVLKSWKWRVMLK